MNTSGNKSGLREVLFLAYFFPPRGGAGVQRSVKFAKYLPQFGWKPLIVANGGAGRDTASAVQDPGLLKDLPADAIVRYTQLNESEAKAYEGSQSKWRKRLCATDPMGWWVSPAVRLGQQLARERRPAAIFVTMSPFTAAEAGIELRRRLRLPLILDLRDPWALDETRIYPTRWHARQDWLAMGRALAAADLVIMNTPEAAQAAREEFTGPPAVLAFGPRARDRRIVCISNGFDADDFDKSPAQPSPADTLRIVHTGMFHTDQAEIWDAMNAGQGWINRLKHPRRPVNLWTRTPRYLLEAMRLAVSRGGIPEGKLELALIGELSSSDRSLIELSPAAKMVKQLGYRTHGESVSWVESADVLFLPLHTPMDGGPALIVPGKAYEYLGSGRPILALGPPGDMRNFVQNAKAGIALAGDDVAGAAEALVKFYRGKVAAQPLVQMDRAAVAQFERRELTRRLAEALDSVVS